jgi:hypothetical protein
MLGGGQDVGANHYPKANLKWPVVIQNGERSIEGVTLARNPNQAYIRCAKSPKLYEVIAMTTKVPDLRHVLNLNRNKWIPSSWRLCKP